MNYPHWHELSAADRAQARHNDAVSLSITTHERTPASKRVAPEEALRIRTFVPKKGRHYKSIYVGVTIHRGRYVSQWGSRGCNKSPVYPFDADGERSAAVARAVALGLTYVELRDGTREAI